MQPGIAAVRSYYGHRAAKRMDLSIWEYDGGGEIGSSTEKMWERAWDRLAFIFFFSLEGFQVCASRSRSTLAELDEPRDPVDPVQREVSSYLETTGIPGEGCREDSSASRGR